MSVPAGKWVGHLRANVAIAREGRDAEGVHQVRVASRRLDAWLRLGKRRVLRADLRWLRGVAGAARDLDVLLLRPNLPEPVRVFLARERLALQEPLRGALADERVDALITALELLPPAPAGTAAKVIPRVMARTLRAGSAIDAVDPDLDALHDLRRAIRRLRFSLEYVGRPTTMLVELQDALGELNDRVVFRSWVARVEDPLAEGLLRELDDDLVVRRRQVAALWHASAARVESIA
jgi:CHAD domain-containing protein